MADAVVVLHGLFQPAFRMRGLCRHLRDEGYSTLNLGYPSTAHTIEQLAEIVAPAIRSHAGSVTGQVHLVGFSLGGLVIRAFLNHEVPANLGRCVLLGTPNRGSEVAAFFKSFPPYKSVFGPAGQQLASGFPENDGAAVQGVDFGVIAGSRSVNPLFNYIIGQPSDGKVSVESTRLKCAVDHLVVHEGHVALAHRAAVWRQAAAFIRDGRFTRA